MSVPENSSESIMSRVQCLAFWRNLGSPEKNAWISSGGVDGFVSEEFTLVPTALITEKPYRHLVIYGESSTGRIFYSSCKISLFNFPFFCTLYTFFSHGML